MTMQPYTEGFWRTSLTSIQQKAKRRFPHVDMRSALKAAPVFKRGKPTGEFYVRVIQKGIGVTQVIVKADCAAQAKFITWERILD